MSQHTPLKTGCINTAFELICSMSVSVNTSLYLLGKNTFTGAASALLIVRTTVERVVRRLALRMQYLRFTSNSDTETVVSHVTPKISV